MARHKYRTNWSLLARRLCVAWLLLVVPALVLAAIIYGVVAATSALGVYVLLLPIITMLALGAIVAAWR